MRHTERGWHGKADRKSERASRANRERCEQRGGSAATSTTATNCHLPTKWLERRICSLSSSNGRPVPNAGLIKFSFFAGDLHCSLFQRKASINEMQSIALIVDRWIKWGAYIDWQPIASFLVLSGMTAVMAYGASKQRLAIRLLPPTRTIVGRKRKTLLGRESLAM